jgi:hypothetical protein
MHHAEPAPLIATVLTTLVATARAQSAMAPVARVLQRRPRVGASLSGIVQQAGVVGSWALRKAVRVLRWRA